MCDGPSAPLLLQSFINLAQTKFHLQIQAIYTSCKDKAYCTSFIGEFTLRFLPYRTEPKHANMLL